MKASLYLRIDPLYPTLEWAVTQGCKTAGIEVENTTRFHVGADRHIPIKDLAVLAGEFDTVDYQGSAPVIRVAPAGDVFFEVYSLCCPEYRNMLWSDLDLATGEPFRFFINHFHGEYKEAQLSFKFTRGGYHGLGR